VSGGKPRMVGSSGDLLVSPQPVDNSINTDRISPRRAPGRDRMALGRLTDNTLPAGFLSRSSVLLGSIQRLRNDHHGRRLASCSICTGSQIGGRGAHFVTQSAASKLLQELGFAQDGHTEVAGLVQFRTTALPRSHNPSGWIRCRQPSRPGIRGHPARRPGNIPRAYR